MNLLSKLSIGVLSAAALVSAANGAITGVAGSTTWLGSPPASCVPGALSGPNAFAWDEKQNVFSAGVFCDMVNNPGTSAGAVPGVLAGNFDSHFIHLESFTGAIVSGSVTFSGQILGVIFRNVNLDVTDASFGSGTTTYPTGYPFRGLNAASSFAISGNLLKFNLGGFTTPNDVIQIRVLTAPVPAPGAAAMLGLGGLVAARRRRS